MKEKRKRICANCGKETPDIICPWCLSGRFIMVADMKIITTDNTDPYAPQQEEEKDL